MRVARISWALPVLAWGAAASAHYYRTPEVPLPTPERPVAIQHGTANPEDNYTYIFFYPTYCSGGAGPKMTGYYSGTYPGSVRRRDLSWSPTKMAHIKFCEGKPTIAFFNGMTYDDFRADVAAGRIVDSDGNRPSINLPEIAYTARLAEIPNGQVDGYWQGPPKPVVSPTQMATSNGGALSGQLSSALAQSFARAPRIQIGLSTGLASVNGGAVVVDIGVQTQEYEFEVQPGVRCVPLKAGQVRCTYAVRYSEGGSMMTIRAATRTYPLVSRTDVFNTAGGSFRSASVDAWTARLAAVKEAPSSGGYDAEAERQRAVKHRECMMDALRDQRMAFCVY